MARLNSTVINANKAKEALLSQKLRVVWFEAILDYKPLRLFFKTEIDLQ